MQNTIDWSSWFVVDDILDVDVEVVDREVAVVEVNVVVVAAGAEDAKIAHFLS
jgi:hypothetical protein